MRKGIDVSSYQGNIDWDRAREYIDFAIIRCGFGNNLTRNDDDKFERNARECARLGIPFGTYLYSYATNLREAQSEVDHTLRLIKDKKLEYPIFLDVEDRRQLALPKETLSEIVNFYCQKIEEAGYYVGIYASLYVLNEKLNTEELNKYDKWVAEWGKDFTYRRPSGMWQYTDNDRIPGIDTRVDGDRAYYNYPEIIKANDLNHLGPEGVPETVSLKYRVGDRLYLNGPLYEEDNAETVKGNYTNERVRIVAVNDRRGILAPYRLNIGGYAKERDLNKEKENCNC